MSKLGPNASARYVLAIALVVGAGLRFYHLGSQGMWIDEGYSLRDAAPGVTIAEASKPLYFGLLGLWMQFTPNTVAWLRAPAAVFGVACIWLMFVVGRRLVSERGAAFAALAMALSPMYIDHSQEIRMYTLLSALVLAQMYFYLLALERASAKRLAACGFFTLLAVLTHPMAVLIVLPQMIILAARNRLNWRTYLPWVATGVAVSLLWLPVLVKVVEFRGYFSEAWTVLEPTPGVKSLAALMGEFMLGSWDIDMVATSALARFYLIYAVGIAAVAGWALCSARREKWAAVVGLWLLIPVTVVGVLAHLGSNLWVPRYMIFVSPALFLLLGCAVIRVRRPWAAALLAVAILALPAARAVRYHARPERPEWPQVAAYLGTHAGPSDHIGVYRRGNAHVFQYYYRGPAKWSALGPVHLYADELTGWTPDRADSIIRELPSGGTRWLAVSATPLAGENQFEEVLRERYRLIMMHGFRGIKLFKFSSAGSEEADFAELPR